MKYKLIRIDCHGKAILISSHETEKAASHQMHTFADSDGLTEKREVTYLVEDEDGNELDRRTSTPSSDQIV